MKPENKQPLAKAAAQINRGFSWIARAVAAAGAALWRGLRALAGRLKRSALLWKRWMGRRLSLSWRRVVHFFAHNLARAKALSAEFKQIEGRRAKAHRAKRAAHNAKPVLRTLFNFSAPVAAVLVLAVVVTSFVQMDYAIAVEDNGEVVAYVKDEQTYDSARAIIAEQLVEVEEEKPQLDVQPTLSLRPVSSDAPVVDDRQLAQTLVERSSDTVELLTGVYVDDIFYGAVKDASLLEQQLQKKRSDYAQWAGVDASAVTLDNRITYKEGLYPVGKKADEQKVFEQLSGNRQEQQTHAVAEGETLEAIAAQYNMAGDQLRALNPGLNENALQIGQPLTVQVAQPLLTLRATKEDVYEEDVPYGQERQDDPNLAVGITNTVQTGSNGRVRQTAQVELVNGQEVSRTIVQTEVLVPVVNEVIQVGTNTASGAAYISVNGSAGIHFIRPVSGGYMSQSAAGGHGAVDIAGCGGNPIVASAPGTVILARWYSGYGNCVIIDHGNGVQTVYGHMASINATDGQRVSQGQQIGIVGNTGNSTGPHVHFEIRINGSKADPQQYCTI